MDSPKTPSLLDALIPVVSLMLLLVLTVYLFGSDSVSGPTQIALILGAAVAAIPALATAVCRAEVRRAVHHVEPGPASVASQESCAFAAGLARRADLHWGARIPHANTGHISG